MSDSNLAEKRRRLAALLGSRGHTGRSGPVSSPQRRLWAIDRLVPGSGAHNIPIVFRSRTEPDREALASALAETVRRHEALRTVFAAAAGSPVQRVLPPYRPEIEQADVTAAAEPPVEAELLVRDWGQRPVDLARGPVLRALTVRVAADDHLIVVMIHHIAFDGFSVVPFFTELDALYRGFRDGNPRPAPRPARAVRRLRGLAARPAPGGAAGGAHPLLDRTARRHPGPAPAARRPPPARRPPDRRRLGAVRPARAGRRPAGRLLR